MKQTTLNAQQLVEIFHKSGQPEIGNNMLPIRENLSQDASGLPCPKCGKVCPNPVYCINCGTMREGSG